MKARKATTVPVWGEWISNFESSNIKEFRYASNTRTLQVRFLRGKYNMYQYSEVLPSDYDELVEAKSKGTWMNANIKKYRFIKIEESGTR